MRLTSASIVALLFAAGSALGGQEEGELVRFRALGEVGGTLVPWLASAAAEASRQKSDIRKFHVSLMEVGDPEGVWVVLRDLKRPPENLIRMGHTCRSGVSALTKGASRNPLLEEKCPDCWRPWRMVVGLS